MNLVLVWLSVTALLLVHQGGVDAKKKSKKGKKSLKKVLTTIKFKEFFFQCQCHFIEKLGRYLNKILIK